jgi:hypothetical protein
MDVYFSIYKAGYEMTWRMYLMLQCPPKVKINIQEVNLFDTEYGVWEKAQ